MYIVNIYFGDWFVKCLNLDLLWSIAFLSHCSVVFKWAHVGGIVACILYTLHLHLKLRQTMENMAWHQLMISMWTLR